MDEIDPFFDNQGSNVQRCHDIECEPFNAVKPLRISRDFVDIVGKVNNPAFDTVVGKFFCKIAIFQAYNPPVDVVAGGG
jgi:hypothetical protein